MANRAILINMIGLRPKISARLPDNGRMAVLDSAYAEPTQVKSSPPFKSLVIVGRAVATAVRSRALRKIDMTTATKESQKAEPFLGLVRFVSPRSEPGSGVDMVE